MGRPSHKLLQEVETRWNSTYHMLNRLVELREPVGAALATLPTDIQPVTSDEYMTITGCLSLLSPFNDATIELSEEKHVSGSKVVPLLKMLEQTLQDELKRGSYSGKGHGRKPHRPAEAEAAQSTVDEHHVPCHTSGPPVQSERAFSALQKQQKPLKD